MPKRVNFKSNGRYKRRRVGSIPDLERVVSTAARVRNALHTITRTQTNNEGASGAITTQKDSMSLYRRRRAPKRVRRKAARRQKVFVYRQLKQSPKLDNLYTANFNLSSAANAQQLNSFTFGYLRSALVNDDIGEWYEAWQNVIAADPRNSSSSLYCAGISYDITITNVSGNTSDDARASELDIYEFVFRKNLNQDSNDSVAAMYIQGMSDEALLPGAATKQVVTNLGWTPFDANQVCKYIVIKSKQRFYLPKDDSISFVKDIKFKRPIRIDSSDFGNSTHSPKFMAMRGLTRGLLIIHKGTPSLVANVGVTNHAVSVQARYRFKILLNKESNANAVGT